MDNDRGIPKTGIPFAVQMVREKIGALRVMPTREEIQKLLAIRMQTGAGLVEFTHSHNLHKIISTHLLTVLTIGAILKTVIRNYLYKTQPLRVTFLKSRGSCALY